MLEKRYYTVIQEREVKITATNPVDAIQIADAFFKDKTIIDTKTQDPLEYATTLIRDRSITAREDY